MNKILKYQKAIFLASALVVAFRFHYLHKFFNQWTLDVSTAIGIAGLGFTIWQAWKDVQSDRETKLALQETKLLKEIDELKSQFNVRVDGLNAEMQRVEYRFNQDINGIKFDSQNNDTYHNQQITSLTRDVATLSSQVTFHCQQFGHPGVAQELVLIRSEVAQLRADQVAYNKIGELYYRVDKMEQEKGELIPPA